MVRPSWSALGPNLVYEAGTKAYQVQLMRLDEPGYTFELAGVKKMTATATPNTKTGVLDIPVVQIQGQAKTYNFQMQKRTRAFIFDLAKARKNCGCRRPRGHSSPLPAGMKVRAG